MTTTADTTTTRPETPPPAGPAIEVRDLRRRYGGGFEAVRGISFTVDRGELFALLGTNGAGKTSALEVIEGLAPPSAGRVRVLGHDPREHRSRVRPRVGIMLQESGLPGGLTTLETVRMWAGTLTAPRPAEEALELVGLRDRAKVGVAQLSGGERRRLDLALALLGRPRVLFLDEPTTGLDPESRRAAWRLVRDLLTDGVTVLLTTHYLEEAEQLADRLAIMHAGEIVVSGTPAEVAASFPARVSFGLPDSVEPAAVPALPGERSRDTDPSGRTTIPTDDLQGALSVLLAWANPRGIALSQLDARPAALEEAFLAVAGAAHRTGGADR